MASPGFVLFLLCLSGLSFLGGIEAGIAIKPTSVGSGDASAQGSGAGVDGSGSGKVEGSAEGLINDKSEFAKQCEALCLKGCEDVPVDCELIGDNVPVNCQGPKQECREGCGGYCACQFECGCHRVEGCDDDCSHACRVAKEGKEGTTTTTTTTPTPDSEVASANNPNYVIYKQGTTTLPQA